MNASGPLLSSQPPLFTTRIARNASDVRLAQRLRYDVFVSELGGDGAMVDHQERLERDRFDAFADHILLLDERRAPDEQVIGVYRVMTEDMAARAGRFYCEAEYDLRPLRQHGQPLLELGRSCLHADYRGGPAMWHLWSALADYATRRQIKVLFGVASFHGTDVMSLSQPLSLLFQRHRAPEQLRVKAIGPTALSMDMQPAETLDRVAAVRAIPALIKAYLRLGGTVGDGAFVDHDFNTVDICLILQSDAIDGLQRAIMAKGADRG